ncbi:hypothetical protein SCD_n00146 [Sulfuricella denitrificans skB26]|uniref:Cache 3/Cache 2 fusion domain-containing protein n=1 Tax=Sulfuricella denitrificans (strain DSM 22764 / NBRC 105220 / skB26) TaxID=1163617 RepID=S6A9F0_SULDS|nr:hypothetical protein [Sulfuricella denitrificans]BAN33995.1 hypothetical protein SCD_n00146 [Sulfuricella denitrificans skB26]
MKKLIVFLLFMPLSAIAASLPDDAGDYIREVQNLVKTEQVVVRNGNGSETQSVGLLISAKEMFISSSELTEGGRRALEKSGRFAKQTNGRLTILMPDEQEHQNFHQRGYSLHGGEVKRNAFIGPYVYIVIAKK